MTLPDHPRLISSLKRFSKFASGIVIFIGGLALVGWMFDIEVLTSGLPGLVAMNPATALAFILSGVSLGLYWLVLNEVPPQER
ncbi:MAG: hypothetical protein HY203_03585 [Nitrospirae bacterium]|nr:hypothetical protein [Nitrospirota bacterium]